MSPTWALVGREAAMARIGEALRGAERRGVMLMGPAGVGKSRLLAACGDAAAQAGYVVARVRASPMASGIPFGALAAILPGPVATGRAEPFAAVRAALRELGNGAPVLLTVDDAHLLDDASAVLVHQLTLNATARVALTVRVGEPVPDPITALWKDELAERIDIGPLDRSSTAALLRQALGGPVAPPAEAAVWQRSKGNALYLREFVVGSLDAGTLVQREGRWELAADALVPARLVDLVTDRLRHLSDPERDGLAIVAFGEPVGVALLEQVVEPSILERLERLELLRIDKDGRRLNASLAHPLHGEVLRQDTPQLAARNRRRLLADLLESVDARRRDDAFRLAVWRLEGGGDIDHLRLVAAAGVAREVGDLVLAERLARAALERGGGFRATFELGLCQFRSGDHDAARATFDRLAETDPSDRRNAALAVARADLAYWGMGDRDEAERILAEAHRSVRAGSAPAADIQSMWAMIDTYSGHVSRAIERALPLVHDSAGYAVMEATIAGSLALVANGQAKLAIDLSKRLQAQPQLPAVVRAAAWRGEALALADLGRFVEAEEVGANAHRLALEINDLTARAYAASVLAWIYLGTGRLEAAYRTYHEAASLFALTDQPMGRRWCLAGALRAAAQYADLGDASKEQQALDALPPIAAGLYHAREQQARAWLATRSGGHTRALQLLIEAARASEEQGQNAAALLVLDDLARLGHADSSSAARLAGRCDSPFLHLLAEHVAAIDTADPDRLAAVADRFEDHGADLLASETAARAADAHAARGNRHAATRSRRRSSEVAARCEGTATPLLASIEAPVPLTRREREIAMLAANGRASRAIAQELFLSTRTVDNHLARVYDKLGVNNRNDLAELLRSRG